MGISRLATLSECRLPRTPLTVYSAAGYWSTSGTRACLHKNSFTTTKPGRIMIVSVPNLVGIDAVYGYKPLTEPFVRRSTRLSFIEQDFGARRFRKTPEDAGFECLNISSTPFDVFEGFPFKCVPNGALSRRSLRELVQIPPTVWAEIPPYGLRLHVHDSSSSETQGIASMDGQCVCESSHQQALIPSGQAPRSLHELDWLDSQVFKSGRCFSHWAAASLPRRFEII